MEKKVVIHVDDIGSSRDANRAAFSLLQNGSATSWSIMVPGKWFLEAIDCVRKNTSIDIWVHLTLTSEWDHPFLKWKPTLLWSEVPSLIDTEWYLRSNVDDVLAKADPEEIKEEIINQIKIAQSTGINISHIDSHMWILLHEKFFPIYQEVADRFAIQPFLARSRPWDGKWNWFYGCDDSVDNLVSHGYKTFDHFDANSLSPWKKEYSTYCKDRIQSIKAGTTYFLIHVLDNHCTNEWMTPDYGNRLKEYRFFGSDVASKIFTENKIQKITMNQL